jgi:hypothetical protein
MIHSSHTTTRIVLVVPLLAIGSGLTGSCSQSRNQSPGFPSSPSFEDAFEVIGESVLEEQAGDSIADIGSLAHLADGRLAIADGLIPRVRVYEAAGALVTASGRFGEGPGEFRRIVGLGEDPHGRLWVADGPGGRISVFGEFPSLDTIIPISPPTGQIQRAGRDVVVSVFPSREGSRLRILGMDGSLKHSFHPPAREVVTRPYWGSVSTYPYSVVGEKVVAANSLVYPLLVYDFGGELVDSMGYAPPSWRQATGVRRGEFAGQGGAERLAEWLDSFTVVAGLHQIGDSLLAVSHATISQTLTAPFQRSEYALDLYHVGTGQKVYEDVKLPVGTRILSGGDRLFVLISEPPASWRIIHLRPKL